MRRVTHPSSDRDALQLARQDIEHRPARDERGRAERDGQHVTRPVVVAARLPCALRHVDRIERRHFGRREVVQRGIDVPAVEARDAGVLVGGRDGRLVEGSMVGVLERRGLEALVIVDGAVADELHLRHARDRFEIWMQDGFLGGLCLVIAMSI